MSFDYTLLSIDTLESADKIQCGDCGKPIYVTVCLLRNNLTGKLMPVGKTCYRKKYGGLDADFDPITSPYFHNGGRPLTEGERAVYKENLNKYWEYKRPLLDLLSQQRRDTEERQLAAARAAEDQRMALHREAEETEWVRKAAEEEQRKAEAQRLLRAKAEWSLRAGASEDMGFRDKQAQENNDLRRYFDHPAFEKSILEHRRRYRGYPDGQIQLIAAGWVRQKVRAKLLPPLTNEHPR